METYRGVGQDVLVLDELRRAEVSRAADGLEDHGQRGERTRIGVGAERER